MLKIRNTTPTIVTVETHFEFETGIGGTQGFCFGCECARQWTVITSVWLSVYRYLKKDSKIRGYEVTLVKDQCGLDIRKYSFSQRTIKEWNKLSTDCVTASSVNMFKNMIDAYLRKAGYT